MEWATSGSQTREERERWRETEEEDQVVVAAAAAGGKKEKERMTLVCDSSRLFQRSDAITDSDVSLPAFINF